MTETSFEALLTGLAANQTAATDRVAREAFARLVGLIRAGIGDRYRAKVDAEAVANSALRSFLRRHAATPYDLGDWEDLWALLAEVARCKLRSHLRLFTAQRRSVAREVADAADADPPGPGAAPDEAVVLGDLLNHLTTGYSDAERAVIEMSLQGYDVNEIAAELGRTARTVVRVRGRFRARLEIERARDAAD